MLWRVKVDTCFYRCVCYYEEVVWTGPVIVVTRWKSWIIFQTGNSTAVSELGSKFGRTSQNSGFSVAAFFRNGNVFL